jgi:hypothetical protein
MPIEAVSTISLPPIFIGVRSARRTRSASVATWRASGSEIMRMANWSLPRRASVSCGFK